MDKTQAISFDDIENQLSINRFFRAAHPLFKWHHEPHKGSSNGFIYVVWDRCFFPWSMRRNCIVNVSHPFTFMRVVQKKSVNNPFEKCSPYTQKNASFFSKKKHTTIHFGKYIITICFDIM